MARGRNLPCPGVPRKAPLLTMTLPREMVVTGIPTTSHPSYGLYCTFMCRVWGDTRSRAVGSMRTMSASLPAAMIPFRGYSPKMRAGLVEATWTRRVMGSRRLTTPSEKRRGIRVSTSTQPGLADGRDRFASRDVHHVHGGPRRAGEEEHAPDALDLREGRATLGVMDGGPLAGGQQARRAVVDDVAVLRVDGRDSAQVPKPLHHVVDGRIVDVQVDLAVDGEHFEGWHAVGHHLLELPQRVVAAVVDHAMEGEVDDGLPLRFLPSLLDRVQ